MDHSITINGEKNSWKDWHLIPLEMPVVAPPTERMIQVTVAGKNGKTDLSHSITGNPVLESREGSWSFYVENESWNDGRNGNYTNLGVYYSGHYAAEQIAQWLALKAGRFQTVVLEDDPNFEYVGRIWVDEKLQQKNGHTVLTLNYSLYPYATVHWKDDWLWDDFCFERDIAWYTRAELAGRALAAGEVLTLQLPPSDVRYRIVVACSSGSVTAVFRKVCYTVPYVEREDYSRKVWNEETKSWTIGGGNSVTISDTVGVEWDLRWNYWELKLTAAAASNVTVTLGEPKFL